MRLFRSVAVASAVVAFAIAVLGSWIRINGAGMTCPDWPLCRGRVIPSLAGGVVLEWSHRAAAFAEMWLLLAAIALGLRFRKQIYHLTATLWALGAMFVIQVLLGALTVKLSNSPLSVVVHWAVAMALLGALVLLALLALIAPPIDRPLPAPDPARLWLAASAGAAFVTMSLGAYVSASFAGLACTTLPACDGSVFGSTPAQLAQMLHRFAAAGFALLAFVATARALAGGSRRTIAFALAGAALVVVQVLLGMANVAWQLPTALREAHAANAGVTFLAYTVAYGLATIDGRRGAAVAVRTPGRLGASQSQAS